MLDPGAWSPGVRVKAPGRPGRGCGHVAASSPRALGGCIVGTRALVLALGTGVSWVPQPFPRGAATGCHEQPASRGPCWDLLCCATTQETRPTAPWGAKEGAEPFLATRAPGCLGPALRWASRQRSWGTWSGSRCPQGTGHGGQWRGCPSERPLCPSMVPGCPGVGIRLPRALSPLYRCWFWGESQHAARAAAGQQAEGAGVGAAQSWQERSPRGAVSGAGGCRLDAHRKPSGASGGPWRSLSVNVIARAHRDMQGLLSRVP